MFKDRNTPELASGSIKFAKGLAIIDAILLTYLVTHFGWTKFFEHNLNTPAASIIYIILLFFHTCEIVLVIGFSIFVTLGIINKFKRIKIIKLGWRIVSALNFIIIIVLILILSLIEIYKMIYNFHGIWPDLLLLLEHLASISNGDLKAFLPGFNQYYLASKGSCIFSLLTFLYLSEKYIFEIWNNTRRVTLLPILIISMFVVIGLVGEIKQTSYFNKQQWNVIEDKKSWPDAVEACDKLGEGWRLPHRSELALFLAKGNFSKSNFNLVWTSTLVNEGDTVLVLQNIPERSRVMRDKEMNYDHNPCATGGSKRFTKLVGFWSIFKEILSYACLNINSPTLYPSKLQFVNEPTGVVDDKQSLPNAKTICIKPESSFFLPRLLGNLYYREKNVESKAALDNYFRATQEGID